MDVSVIIPIYKGNGYIESLLNKIEKNYQESQKEIEVIFVNDYPDEEIIEMCIRDSRNIPYLNDNYKEIKKFKQLYEGMDFTYYLYCLK